MSHLLALSVGPVQEFIAAARRTRDLWFGSYLLSEISRAVAEAVAKAVKAKGGRLIFPASLKNADNIANVILAELDAGEPQEVATQAKLAAQKRWRDFAEEAERQVSSVICHDLWTAQVDDVIEFFAAWVEHTEPANYSESRAMLMRLLSGRKNCRDFLPAKGRGRIPKSSLDGQRETVLNSNYSPEGLP